MTNAPGDKLSSLDGSASDTNWDEGSMTLGGTTRHFSQVAVVKLADTTFTPKAVVAFVGAPPWTVDVTFTNPYPFPINMTHIKYHSDNPIGRPGLTSAPDFSVAGHGSGSLASSPPTFDCKASGDGPYFVDVEMDALGDEGSDSSAKYSYGHAWCFGERPVFTASLQPPSTIFTVSAVAPALGSRELAWTYLYNWRGAIGCGAFEPFSVRPADFKETTDPEARWTHPNAPDPSRAHEDFDHNGVPDFCPHSEELNVAHPGTVSVEISVSLNFNIFPVTLLILCTYSGSLSGTGECKANMPP